MSSKKTSWIQLKEREAQRVRFASPEKKAPAVTVKETDDHEAAQATQWNPGVLARFPWLGLGSLFMVLVCIAGSVVTLCVSDGKSQTFWPKKLAPNVLLSALSAAEGIFFGIAVSTGVTITWWRKVLKGSTVKELHQSWTFSSSITSVFFAGASFNWIALAALTAKLTIIDGILMQRAHNTEILANPAVNTTLWAFASKDIPITGIIQDSSGLSGNPLPFLSNTVKTWQRSPSTMRPVAFSGCTGLCHVDVPAAGFEFDCPGFTSTSVRVGNTTKNETVHDTMLDIKFEPVLLGDEYIELTLSYTEAESPSSSDGKSGCPATQHSQTCKLRPALVSYPVTISNYHGGHTLHTTSTVTLKSSPFDYAAGQQNAYDVIRRIKPEKDRAEGKSGLGGLAWAFQDQFDSNSKLTQAPNTNPQTSQTGSASSWLVKGTSGTCAYEYANPLAYNNQANMPALVESINQIMFAFATDINRVKAAHINENFQKGAWQQVPGTQQIDAVHYVTDYAYMFGAVASSLICVLLILPTYYGFWQLGRKVTLGPLEIAHAFRSPVLVNHSDAPANSDIDRVIEHVGHQPVQLGAIAQGPGRGVVGVAPPEEVRPLLHTPSGSGPRLGRTW